MINPLILVFIIIIITSWRLLRQNPLQRRYRNVYCGYLVNITDKGLGIISLRNSGQLIPKIKDFITDIDNYVFIGNDEIARISIEKLPLHFSTKKLVELVFSFILFIINTCFNK